MNDNLKPTTQQADVSMPETFEDYMRNARDEFVMEVKAQDWNTKLRTTAEDLLICFDQMREKLTTKQADVSIWQQLAEIIEKSNNPTIVKWVKENFIPVAGYAAANQPQKIEEILQEVDAKIERSFVTAKFGDNWRQHYKRMLDEGQITVDMLLDIALKQGRRALLLEDVVRNIK